MLHTPNAIYSELGIAKWREKDDFMETKKEVLNE